MNHAAFAEITPLLYSELRRIAARHLGAERSNHTLQATALVHEAYLKLAATGTDRGAYSDDVHFLATASRAMRQILVDHARAHSAQKRPGVHGVSLATAGLQIPDERSREADELIRLDDALTALAAENKELAQLIEMRFFGGMTAEESAQVLGRSVHVVRHDLRYAQAWLRRRLLSLC